MSSKPWYYRMTPDDFQDGCDRTYAALPDEDLNLICGVYLRMLHMQFKDGVIRGSAQLIARKLNAPELIVSTLIDQHFDPVPGDVPQWANARMASCRVEYERHRLNGKKGGVKKSRNKAKKLAGVEPGVEQTSSGGSTHNYNYKKEYKKKKILKSSTSTSEGISEPLASRVEGGGLEEGHDVPASPVRSSGRQRKPQDAASAARPSEPPAEKRISRKTVLPGDWVLPLAYRELGRSLGLTDPEIDFEAAKFKHWALNSVHRGKPLSRDWPATWRTWCSRVAERKQNREVRKTAPAGSGVKVRRL